MIPAELLFWYELALKMALTAAIVVGASVAVERSGPFIGALIATLPTAAGAAYIILALEHPPAFIAASAIGSAATNAVVGIFALTYAWLAQRHGVLLSISIAILVWFCAATALRLIEWSPARALALNALVFAIALPASAPFRRYAIARKDIGRTRYDLPLRAAAAALVVGVVTTASHHIGSFASGTFAVFPIVMGTFVVILHAHAGGKAASAVFAHAEAPLIGLGLAFLGVHYLAESIGVWWAYAAGLAITMGWSGVLWVARRWLPRML
ncbi:MAG: hypothetical protein QOD29_825 [Alphaproteobacteria bacterium]|nr:hypothetical protein [Alphaproteobacteria bacterium]